MLLGVEAVRACRRYATEYGVRAQEGLAGLALLPVSEAVLGQAAALAPTHLRSLDAVHLATALSIRDDVGVLVSYDRRLLEATAAHAIAVVAPL